MEESGEERESWPLGLSVKTSVNRTAEKMDFHLENHAGEQLGRPNRL